MLFAVKRLGLELPVPPPESPSPSLLLFALFLHLKTAMTWSVDQGVIGSISWKSWQYSVVLRLSCGVPVCPSQAGWKWTMLNWHKNSKTPYWFFLDFLGLILRGISYYKFQSQTSHFSCLAFFALVFGGVDFAVAALFSLTTFCSEMIFNTAPSVTRLWVRCN